MTNIKQWIEEHPYLSGSVIVGFLILFFVMRNRSASSSASTSATDVTGTTGPSESLQALGLQAGTQLQEYQIAANTQIANLNSKFATDQLAASLQATKNYYDYQTNLSQIIAQGTANSDYTNATLQLGMAQILAGGGVSGSQITETTFGRTELSALQTTQQQQMVNAVPSSPAVPVVFAPANPPQYSVPSPSGATDWNSYYSNVLSASGLTHIGDPTNGATAAALNNLFVAAQDAYISDPNSPHNLPPGCVRQSNGLLQCA